MKVKELIKALEELKRPDAKVYISFDAGWGSGEVEEVVVTKRGMFKNGLEEGDVALVT